MDPRSNRSDNDSGKAQGHSFWSWFPVLLAVGLPLALALGLPPFHNFTGSVLYKQADLPTGVALHPATQTAVVTPHDPIESGSSSIHLTLQDSVTREPISSHIYLWRLNAPANEIWGEGDQCQFSLNIPAEGQTIRELAPGQYRAQVKATSLRSNDPSAFLVEANSVDTHQGVSLSVARPSVRPAFTRIVDRHGNPITEIRKPGSGSRHGHQWTAPSPTETRNDSVDLIPSWITARKPKDPDTVPGYDRGGGKYGGRGSGLRTETIQATDPRGFELGKFREPTLYTNNISTTRCATPEGRAHVNIRIDRRDASPWEYCGLSIERVLLLESIHLPDGRTGSSISDSVDIASQAIMSAAATEGWEDQVVTVVTVDHPDYERLQFGYRLLEGEPPIRTLSRR